MFGVLSWFVVGSHCQSCHPLNDDPISVFPLHFLMFTKCFMARMFLTWIAAPILPPLDCGGRRRRSDYILLYQSPDPPWMSASASSVKLHFAGKITLITISNFNTMYTCKTWWCCELSSQSHCWKWWWFHPILVCSVLLLRVYCEGTMLQSSGSVEKKPYNPQSTIQFHHLFSPLFVRLAECRVPGAGHTGVSVPCHGEIQDQPIISPFQTFIIMPESSVLPYS